MTGQIGRKSDLGTRAVAGVAMIAVALAALWAGGIAFWLLASAAAMLMMAEWAGLMRASGWKTALSVAILFLVLIAGVLASTRIDVPVDMIPAPSPDDYKSMLLAAVLGGAAVMLLTLSPRLGVGVLYAALPTLGLVWLRTLPDGLWLALWTLAVVWATDIGAYFAGRAIGGPKLAPAISPAKTWSGLGGGVLAALIVGAAIATQAGTPRLLLLGAPMAVLAQGGDLFESWLKRRAGVKDSGQLLPGHGGVLDRLDGLVPVAVAVALLLMLGWL